MQKYIDEYSTKLVKVSSIAISNSKVESSQDAINVIKHFFDHDDKEKLYVILLNSRKDIIGINLVSIGTVDYVIMHPREIFKTAILTSASGIILVHNHPSGNVFPSDQDIAMTNKIIESGEILEIPILDHIIYSEEKSYSIYDGEEIHE